ncbi:MAG: hypothetical protein R3245_04640, partial [Kiloniellales bacterium]|nr:hypothetical protein [Kiloniellales bacterium]
EPTGNLDDKLAIRLLYLFEELNKLGTTVVIATHNQNLTEKFPHAILALKDGRVSLLRQEPERVSDRATNGEGAQS